MSPKKILKIFSIIGLIVLVVVATGSFLLKDFSFASILSAIFPNAREKATYVEDIGEFIIDDIIPDFNDVEVWKGNSKWTGESKEPCSDEVKTRLVSALNESPFIGVSKKDKKEWLPKDYPYKENGTIDIYSFYPKDSYLEVNKKTIEGVKKWEITDFHIIKNSNGQIFLTVYYYQNSKSNEKESAYSYYYLREASALKSIEYQ